MTLVLDPPRNCKLCPRLVDYRLSARKDYPDWHNAPVPNFGAAEATLLIVGLAPGLKGANRTGRPFTGDYAGDLLYRTLIKFGFAKGFYEARPDDGLTLIGAKITNAVRCVPPENKPTPAEIKTCRPFLEKTIDGTKGLKAIVALGRIAHDAVIKSFGKPLSAHPFAHGAAHELDGPVLFDSYHCSRYNTNTGVLTDAMFEAVFTSVRAHIDGRS
ncbi:MAG: uracil-DNA glycosylase [Hyphomicrobiales bacterium]|jgi:uracil-DNA glycosylase family 4|nr:uracil-DNA glycosylase [Hyphomicrobiales bacterium]